LERRTLINDCRRRRRGNVYSQECPVIAYDTAFHEAMYQLQGPCEFGRFRSRVAEDPRGSTNYKRPAKFEDVAEV